MKPDEIILKGDELLEEMSKVNGRLYKKALEFITLNLKDGKVNISTDQLAMLEEMLYKEIKDSDYEENLVKYVELFDALLNAIDNEQVKRNSLKNEAVKNLWSQVENTDIYKQKAIDGLGRNGLTKTMIKGIADVVRDVNFANMDFKNAVNTLETKLIGIDQNYTQKYVKTLAMDILRQFDGAVQDEVRKTYGFTKFKYITRTIETSRPFCVHLHDELGGDLTIEQLKKALDEYCPGGVPSETKIDYKVHTGEIKTAKKGSGMMPGTNLTNFAQNAGGYGCRHRVIWYK